MRKLTILLIALSFSIISFAQNKNSFGIKCGIINNNVYKDYSSKLGTCTGIFGSFKISNTFSFQPEILFSSKGYKVPDDVKIDPNVGIPLKRKGVYYLNYLELPLLLKAGFGKKHRPYLLTGIVPGIVVISKLKDDTGLHKIVYNEKFDLGATIGGGIDLYLSENHYLFIEPRINLPLVNYGNLRNQSIYLLVGLRW